MNDDLEAQDAGVWAGAALTHLREMYERGLSSLAPSPQRRDGGSHAVAGSRAPLPVHLLDVLHDVEEHLNDVFPELTHAIGSAPSFTGLPDSISARTLARLEWLDGRIGHVATYSPALCRKVAGQLMAGGNRIMVALGEKPRAFASERACPECDGVVWVDPESLTMKCEACFAQCAVAGNELLAAR